MSVETWDAWVRILRDILIVAIGSFMLIFETVVAATPNAYLIGAGLAALGLPPALRLDLRTSAERKRRRDDTNGDETRHRNGGSG